MWTPGYEYVRCQHAACPGRKFCYATVNAYRCIVAQLSAVLWRSPTSWLGMVRGPDLDSGLVGLVINIREAIRNG